MMTSVLAICLAVQISATGSEYPPVRIGFVDRDELFKAPRVERMLEPLRESVKTSEAEFERRWDELLAEIRDFEAKKEFMDEEGIQDKEVELKKGRDEILAYIREKKEALEEERDAKMRQILTEIRDMVRQVAQEQGYTLVLWKSAIAYGAPEHDLTQMVMKRILDLGKEEGQ